MQHNAEKKFKYNNQDVQINPSLQTPKDGG